MRRIFACVLCVLLLAGCGAGTAEKPAPSAEDTGKTVNGETGTPEPDAGLVLEMEHECYDASLDRYTYFVRNGTDEAVFFGEAYSLQRQTDGGWKDLTIGVPGAFTAIGYEVQPDGAMALTCSYNTMLKFPGTYRLVKEVGGETLYAEFEIGDSPYTAKTPYGFQPLEDLPDDYSAATASDADAVFTGDGVQNPEAAETFLEKVRLGIPCQLRTVQDYGEGEPMVIDAVFENGHFLWRVRSGGKIYDSRFAYVVTDGADIYLSNGADWENTVGRDSEKAFLLPEGTVERLVPAVEAMTADRLAGNSARYRVWSADGVWDAGLSDSPTEFAASSQSGGAVYDLQDWDGLETAILDLKWQEDNTLRLTCELVTGETGVLRFDPRTEKLSAEICALPPADRWISGMETGT